MASDTKTNVNVNEINRATTGRDTKDTNPDLITGAPGSHPVGTGVGAAAGGAGAALAGAAIGAAMSGPAAPIGAVVGAIIGAVGGGLVGKSAAEAIDPTAEDAYWQERHKTRDYVQAATEKGATYEKDLRPAYQYGWESSQAHAGKSFDEAEPTLAKGWDAAKGESKLGWDHAKHATRDAWDKLSTGKVAAAHDLAADARETVPVLKENLQVGKEQVETGGVRVNTRIEERPVEAQVKLREEEVHVNRKAVDRPIAAGDATAFQEGVIEMTETAERAVVSKEARVVEEVQIGKTATERTETVKDSVRETKVDVQPVAGVGATTSTTYQPYATYGTGFRTHWQQSSGTTGGQYESYEPAYQYGYNLATDDRYKGVNDWSKVEAGAKSSWEAHNVGTWDKFKGSVQHAWEKVRAGK